MAFSGFATLANAFCLVVVPPVLKPNNYPHTTLLIGLFYGEDYVMHAPPTSQLLSGCNLNNVSTVTPML